VAPDPPAEWPACLRRLLTQHRTDCIVLFGQSRLYHRDALAVAAEAGIPVVVLEEGYFRPGFVTMESGGVHSPPIPLDEYPWGATPPGSGTAPVRRPRALPATRRAHDADYRGPRQQVDPGAVGWLLDQVDPVQQRSYFKCVFRNPTTIGQDSTDALRFAPPCPACEPMKPWPAPSKVCGS